MNKFSLLCTVSMFGLMTITTNCNNGTNPSPTPPGPLQLLKPLAPGSVTVGQFVTIQWKINDTNQISSVGVELSIDSGKSWPFELTDHSLPHDTTSIAWIPSANQVSPSCMIKVYSYTNLSVNDKSSLFRVTN